MMAEPLTALSARELIARMRSGAVSAVAVTEAHFAEVEAREPSLRAWAYLDKAGAMAAAARADAAQKAGHPLGPLHGLPVGVKDIIDTADMPTEYGAALHAGRRPSEDATIVARLRAAGAIVIGKTVTAQYAMFAPGRTRNPHDLARTPGGSSSGSAAAVAAFMTPLALATQTKGSIIRPASFCGVVGYKPSLGLLPRNGVLRLSSALDQPGVMTRNVADAALAVDLLSGRDEDDEATFTLGSSLLEAIAEPREPPRLALVRGPYWSRAEAATREAVEAFAASLPGRVDTLDLPAEFEDAEPILDDIMTAGAAQSLAVDFARGRATMPDSVVRIIEKGRALSAVALMEALAQRDELRRLFARMSAPYDALLTAASVGVAPPAAAGTGDPIMATTWTLVGAPSVSLPLLKGESGLPLGLQLVGGPRRDHALLSAAAQLMQSHSN
jgi:Asp-tRNA(Asn)/Glu-tRNA(Gln) amidotransferase A subunit family amidase